MADTTGGFGNFAAMGYAAPRAASDEQQELDEFARELIAAKAENDDLAAQKKKVDAHHKEKNKELFAKVTAAKSRFDGLKVKARELLTGSREIAGVGKVTIAPAKKSTRTVVDYEALTEYLAEHQPGILEQFTSTVDATPEPSVRITLA